MAESKGNLRTNDTAQSAPFKMDLRIANGELTSHTTLVGVDEAVNYLVEFMNSQLLKGFALHKWLSK